MEDGTDSGNQRHVQPTATFSSAPDASTAKLETSPQQPSLPSTSQQSSSWLLRLFQSDFFDARLAVSYLYRYPDTVGIQFYVCNRLKSMPHDHVIFLLPQLCHLLVNNPTSSSALEEFMLAQSEASAHWGLMMLWYLQTYMYDQRLHPMTPSYRLIKRVFHRCQAIIFADTPDPTQTLDWNTDTRIRENIPPAIVGLGAMMGGIGGPHVMQVAREMVIAQGRRWRSWGIPGASSNNSSASSAVSSSIAGTGSVTPPEEEDNQSPTNVKPLSGGSAGPSSTSAFMNARLNNLATAVRRPASLDSAPVSHLIARIPTSSPSVQDMYHGTAFSFGRYAAKASGSASSLTMLPHGKASWSTSTLDLRHAAAVKAAGAAGFSTGTTSPVPSHASTHKASSEYSDVSDEHKHLVGSHYYHAELQFIMALTEISNRLLSVPREARQRTLVAELELLNHNLPAEICIPLWCASKGLSGHHKVVRIPPADAVVLNSADRVPYLLLVEVIESEEASASKTPQLSPLWSRDGSIVNGTDGHDHADVGVDGYNNSDNDGIGIGGVAGLSEKALTASETTSEHDLHGTIEDKVNDTADILHDDNITNGSITRPRAPSAISFPEEELFAEKMRTAAVMLAQLYQQQQRELIAFMGINSNTLPANLTPLPLQPLANPSNNSSTPATRTSTGANGAFPGSPALGRADRRKYQKMKTDFEMIRGKIVKEMMVLEESRLKLARESSKTAVDAPSPVTDAVEGSPKPNGIASSGSNSKLDEAEVKKIQEACLTLDKEDPSAAVFREDWEQKLERVRAASPYGSNPRWRLISVIVKSGADLRQEQLALQLIEEMQRIWKAASLDLWVCSYRVLVTSEQSGLVETVRNSISIHSIKKNAYAQKQNQSGVVYSLYDHFIDKYGHPNTDRFQRAQDHFMKSLAGYSIATYLLQLRDRHNGNILLLSTGHLVHIDFGFMLTNSPGSVGFELAPFKLPQEYLDIMGGPTSPKFEEFRKLVKLGFMAIRKNYDKLVALVEMLEKDSALPCFTGFNTKPPSTYIPNTSELLPNGTSPHEMPHGILDPSGGLSSSSGSTIPPSILPAATSPMNNYAKYPVTNALRERFQMQLSEAQAAEFVDRMVDSSANNVFTRLYDTFQEITLPSIEKHRHVDSGKLY
ncbi:hypothetical protein SmJEL517_g05931 [Synchytrium microbalum]|uniref:1-phosphatidylinositol 4-kinase n=1 Tax=Synchytrium microbalum TaxID=1806994 RepID=A0A507BIG7_9FUNG|nr:uncharacterized protein SmJEL517_g05931 [Synchytrium microbalum]TPX30520.1 hypothetical protein SmJEL517_g05931 [Synchytrium microbalum]